MHRRGGFRPPPNREAAGVCGYTGFESYYRARLADGVFSTVDRQHVTNPAYSRDRGRVWIGARRLHLEWGKRGR